MAYVNADYYTNTFGGVELPATEIDKYLDRASDDIDELTFMRIKSKGFDNLTAFQQDRVQKAVCYQADYNYLYFDSIESNLGGYSVGDVSINNGTSGKSGSTKPSSYSTAAFKKLVPTNLVRRGL